MALGSDNTICMTEFKEAMRARLEADRPGSGANVDLPDVEKNFAALGTAVFKIMTLDANVTSGASADAAFWAWVAAVQAWIAGVRQAVNTWAPTQPAEQSLRTAILALTVPTAVTSLHSEVK